MSRKGNRLRTAELVAAIVVAVVLVLVLMPLLRAGREPFDPRTCQGNLKQWGAIFSMYAEENEWFYPVVHGFEAFGKAVDVYDCANIHDDFDFCPNLAAVYPDYADELELLVCPDGPHRKRPFRIGPFELGSYGVDEQALGVLRSIGTSQSIYEGLVTNGDVSYTYLGWRVDRANDGDPYIDADTAERLGLRTTGPAQVVALIEHLDPPPDTRFAGKLYEKRRAQVAVDPVDLGHVLRGLGPEAAKWGNGGESNVLQPCWIGWYFGETHASAPIVEGGLGDWEEDFAPTPQGRPPTREWQAVTPVMWDTVYVDRGGAPGFVHRDPDGVNVLYMDGHVEFLTYPGAFPVSNSFIRTNRVPPEDADTRPLPPRPYRMGD